MIVLLVELAIFLSVMLGANGSPVVEDYFYDFYENDSNYSCGASMLTFPNVS